MSRESNRGQPHLPMPSLNKLVLLVLFAGLALFSASLITGCTVTGHSPWTLDK